MNVYIIEGLRFSDVDFKELRYADYECRDHSREDVVEGPVGLPVHAVVVVRKADGQEPLDRHRDQDVDGADQGDPVERVVEPGKDVQQEVRVIGSSMERLAE